VAHARAVTKRLESFSLGVDVFVTLSQNIFAILEWSILLIAVISQLIIVKYLPLDFGSCSVFCESILEDVVMQCDVFSRPSAIWKWSEEDQFLRESEHGD